MYILGFNSTHDASVSLVKDGRVVFSVEEERLSREKHHYGFPYLAMESALRWAGISFGDLSHMAFYWNPWKGLLPFGLHFLRHLPRSLSYLSFQPGIWGNFIALPRFLKREVGFRGKLHFIPHHTGHVYSAFAPSPFDRAAILSMDGTGEWTTTLLARGNEGGIRSLKSVQYPHSLGKVYEAVTQYLGFLPNSGEGKVMGLAPYGNTSLLSRFRTVFQDKGRGLFRVEKSLFQYFLGKEKKYSPKFTALFGSPRERDGEIEEHHKNVARALQEVVEERGLKLVHHLHSIAEEESLCLAGGVALNCVMNGRLLREGPFARIFVQPAANDSGSALGAALAVHHRLTGTLKRWKMEDVYLGPGFPPEECRRALEAKKIPFKESQNIAGDCARLLSEGKVVGWFQGRMEFGPRALGNRSILADPRRAEMKEILNLRVKHREAFRPFAPSVQEEEAEDFFLHAASSPFMILAFPVRPERQAQIPAVVHVDGTARVHTVSREVNPLFWSLLEEFKKLTGVPLVLNTSFNTRGEPIVCTPEQAIQCFADTQMDAMALGNFLAEKEP